ncbi:MAG: carboxypeptidase regulatory-like domain-containing protein [Gemmatimonadota bacterium]
MRRCRWVTPIALLVMVIPSSRLVAQSQAATGLIRGIVQDPGGTPVAGAAVTLRAHSTNLTRRVATNNAGWFVAPLLPVGTYEVVAEPLGQTMGRARRDSVELRLGQAVQLELTLGPVAIAGLVVETERPLVDPRKVEHSTRFSREAVSRVPNNGRNFLSFIRLTPNATVVQGPDGDELSISGQRGIHNNVSVDGADFNNAFFGEHRGGQRPAFTFNQDAVQEIVVVSSGASAEFGRSGSGFVNVLTRSGSNEVHGSMHYLGKHDALASVAEHGDLRAKPVFSQHQLGFTFGAPLKRDRAFLFVAYDHQTYDETRQQQRPVSAAYDSLRAWTDTAFGGALRGDFQPIQRTNDGDALIAKLDFAASAQHTLSLKYNYTNSDQVNGTFDVDTWGRSANAIERDHSHAVNGAIVSQLSSAVANEFRFQVAREYRPRDYEGPQQPGQDRPFPDTGMDFVNGFRIGLPFFIPVEEYDTRIQLLNNISWLRGRHLFKAGVEWNRNSVEDIFIGFANGRYIFNSVTGFLNYVQNGRNYVECNNGPARTDGQCPGGTITGPVLLYLQQSGVGGRSVVEAGTQAFSQHDLSAFIQDSWTISPALTIDYGLRWDAQVQPEPLTEPEDVFFAPFIGQTVSTSAGSFRFPSDGTFPSDWKQLQPRVGVAWDISGDGRQVLRASSGLYYARTPGLVIANVRSSNGSIGQTMFRSSELIGVLGPPPVYGQLLPSENGVPFAPSVMVFDRDYRNPRTISAMVAYQRALGSSFAGQLTYSYARADFLTRFVNRNDAVFGSPWSRGLEPGGANGIGTLTVAESSAKSRYHALTLQLDGKPKPALEFHINYSLSFDRSDDDNERDPFSFRYARADRLDREFNWSDRDQRHRFNAWLLTQIGGGIALDNRVSWYSAQPMSEKCGPDNRGSGERAAAPSERICPNGTILDRNTLRRDNAFFSWDVSASRPFPAPHGRLVAVIELFNALNTDNFRDPSPAALLFNFDGTVRSGLGDPRQLQAGVRWVF